MVGMATVEEGANVLYVVLVADLHRLRRVGHHWRNNWIFSCRMRRSEVKLEDFCPRTLRTSFNFHPVLVFVCNMWIEIWNMESRVGSHPSVTISRFHTKHYGIKSPQVTDVQLTVFSKGQTAASCWCEASSYLRMRGEDRGKAEGAGVF